MDKKYLGDGVYAEFDGYHIVLTTENGAEVTNTIFMEPAVFIQLKHYVDQLAMSMEKDPDLEEPETK